MADVTTEYMGLKLKNPLVVGSCGLTSSLQDIEQIAANGAGAVVLKSLFEEEILLEVDNAIQQSGGFSNYGDAENYINYYTKQKSVQEYLALIDSVKKTVDIPVIASVNCVSDSEWISFAKSIANAGADALELNMFIVPADINKKSADIEQVYFDIVKKITNEVDIPVSVKVGSYFSGLGNMLVALSQAGISGMVLFNRFYNPDIDIDKQELVSGSVYSSSSELYNVLRWIGIVSPKAGCDLAATSGIHTGSAMIKALLAGAKVTYVVSTLYNNGIEYIKTMLGEVEQWMTKNNYNSIEEFRGKLNQDNISDPVLFERAQFMKYFSGHKG